MTVTYTDRLYKNRPRNIFSDPITGVTRKLNFPRVEHESFDVNINRPRFPKNRYAEQIGVRLSGEQGNTDRISGALRKEVPSLTYVNPY